MNLVSGQGINTYIGSSSDLLISGFGSMNNYPVAFYQNGIERARIHTNGYFGIGTQSPGSPLSVRAASASGLEDIARFEVANDTNSYLKILNGTGATSIFVPTIEGKQSANQEALFLTAQGTDDTGTTPIMVFDSRINASTSVTRPLFQWNNFSTPVMFMNASGNLGINTNTPNNKLQVVGTTSVTNFIMTGGSPALNEVLTSLDSNGSATWSTPASVVANASGVTGSGVSTYVPYWNSSNNLSATSSIFISGASVGVNMTSPTANLDVNGSVRFNHNSSTNYTLFQNGNEVNTYVSNGIATGVTPSTLFIQYAQANNVGAIANIGRNNLIVNSNFTGSSISGLTITTASNVGIGVGLPGAKLEVYDASDSSVWINSAGNSYLKLKRGILNADAHISFETTTSQKHIVGLINNSDTLILGGTEATPSIFVTTASNVGIGSATPSAKLDVAGSINILSGLNNSSPRPSLSAGTLTKGEIRAYSATASTQDDGFLRISAGGGSNPGSGKTYIDITGYSTINDMNNNVVIGTRGTERMRVDLNGNVGIGTPSPSASLHVYGATAQDLVRITQTGLGNAFVVEDSSPDTSEFFIDATGNVGIGLTQTTYKLDVNGTQRIYGQGLTGSTLFTVQGTSGELFTIVDSLTGSLFSVNDISGLPILETFADSTTLIGSYLAPSLYTTKKVTLTAGVTTSIYSIATASYNSAYFDYNAINGINARAGSIMSVWNGASFEFTETTTNDIGNTTGLTFSFSLGSGLANLRAFASSAGWTIKTIIRSI